MPNITGATVLSTRHLEALGVASPNAVCAMAARVQHRKARSTAAQSDRHRAVLSVQEAMTGADASERPHIDALSDQLSTVLHQLKDVAAEPPLRSEVCTLHFDVVCRAAVKK